jgi:copper transport protein
VNKNGYRVELLVNPNRAAAENTFSLRISRNGEPVTGAEVVIGVTMLDMEMGTQSYTLTETSPGTYSASLPALVMVGHWGLSFDVTPKNGTPFSVLLVDRANG